MTAPMSIGSYLISRLHAYGVRHVFGIPGDYVLGFYDQLQRSTLHMVGTTKEDGAGFAADAYARVHGMGAVCVTYCVGGLSVANAIAGAYAEKSPVVVISGAPGLGERLNDPLLHHKIRSFSSQKEIFEKITVASAALDDVETAFRQIDDCLEACWRYKRPVYLELPRDLVDAVPRYAHRRTPSIARHEPHAAKEALAEAVARINGAKRPVILADVEVHRFGLMKELEELTTATGIPVAVTILGKSVISELHPNYIGVYEGAMGRSEVREQVEDADCLLMLGTVLSDVNLGIFTAKLDQSRVIEITSERVCISHHRYERVDFAKFVKALAAAPLRKRKVKRTRPGTVVPLPPPSAKPVSVTTLFAMINERLTEEMAVVCDVGLCLFGAIDLVIHRHIEFIAPAYYTSMGFAIPASVGCALANPRLRPLVIVGDGAFQMTGMELSTVVAQGLDPIVIVLNNHGYTTERLIMDGPYNDIHGWNFERIPDVLGSGWARSVRTEREFSDAWDLACAYRGRFSLISVELDRFDHCPALGRLGERMAANLPSKASKA